MHDADPRMHIAMRYARLVGRAEMLIGQALVARTFDDDWKIEARQWQEEVAAAEVLERLAGLPGEAEADSNG